MNLFNASLPRIFGVRISYSEYLFYRRVWEQHYAGLPNREPVLEFPNFPVYPLGIGRLMENFLENAASIWGNRLDVDREYLIAGDHSEGHTDLCGCEPSMTCRICENPRWQREARLEHQNLVAEEREAGVLIGQAEPIRSQLSLESLRIVCEELREARPHPTIGALLDMMFGEDEETKPQKLETGAETQSTPRGNFNKTGKTLNADEDLDRLFEEIDAIT